MIPGSQTVSVSCLVAQDITLCYAQLHQNITTYTTSPGWTAIASGFIDSLLPMLLPSDPTKTTLRIPGAGTIPYPFTIRHDIGRVLAHTFQYPEKYKNVWLSVVTGWYTFNDIKSKIEAVTGRSWDVERVETTSRMPILHLAEQNQWDILPRQASKLDAPVQLANFDEVIEHYAQTLT